VTAWGPDRHRHPKMRKWSGGDSNPDFLCRRIDACVTTVPIRTAQPDTTPSSRFTETKPPRLTTDVHECWVLSCAKLTVSDGAQHLPTYTLRKSLTPANNSAHILLALPPYLRGSNTVRSPHSRWRCHWAVPDTSRSDGLLLLRVLFSCCYRSRERDK